VQRLTLGTLMMSALFLAGCGGGTGSVTPRASNQTTPAAAGRHTKTLRDGLAAGDLRPLCGPVGSRRARCMSYALTESGLAAAPLVASRTTLGKGHFAPQGYGPDDLQAAYSLTKAAKSNGFGAVVAIVDAFDDPQAEHDLAVYRAQYGLPPCTSANRCFQKVNQDGRPRPLPPAPTADASGWTAETSLDLDMVSANCPNCRILLVESNDDYLNNLGTAVNAAANLGAVAISNSYAAQESSTDPAPIAQGGLLPYYVHPHVAVVVASGDYGYAFSGNSYGALIPAAFPSVVAVGGTELTPNPHSKRGWDEAAWDGTGSGCSAYEAMPPWQQADPNCVGSGTDSAGNAQTFSSRIYGDVAYDASAYTGVAVYDSNGQFGTNGWGVLGGTSVASPAIAAIYGLAGYGAPGGILDVLSRHERDEREYPFPAQKLYESKGSLFDIAGGTNGDCSAGYLCTARPGFDGPTGNGTPNGIGAF
jgi:hypothetical protein